MNTLLMQCKAANIILPLPSSCLDRTVEQAVYARFMHYLRGVRHRDAALRILSAIRFSSDILDYSDAHVAKVLVDLGLRAPRRAFPADFLSFADEALLREAHDFGAPNAALQELQMYWEAAAEDVLASSSACARGEQYSLPVGGAFAQG